MSTSDAPFPIYKALLDEGRLGERVAAAEAALHDCHLCGRDCGIDRTERAGPCRIQDEVYVASFGPHFGEENPLRGSRGSGTIFFAGCNLHCIYCQNCDISQRVTGSATPPDALASIMLNLQERGCHNINLVSPTHVASHIVPGLALAIQAGLEIPIVYNTGGYDAPQALALMDGLVDIYMPDMKYADPDVGRRFSAAPDYPVVNQAAVREMHRQVGDLTLDARGIARRGLLVRHLVLPDGLAGTAEIAQFLAEEISPDIYINIMRQYRPAYEAWTCESLDRRITEAEYQAAIQAAKDTGLHRFSRR